MLRKLLGNGFMVVLILIGLAGWTWSFAHQPGRFPLEHIQLQGVEHTDIGRVQRVLGVPRGTNLLLVDLEGVRKRLLSLPWVRNAQVERLLTTGTLRATLTEKTAVGLSRDGDRLMLMDEYGSTIKPLEREDPLVLPVVSPAPEEESATASMVSILNVLSRHSWLKKRVSEAKGRSSGRWTIYTHNGIKLLFSQRLEEELELLKQLQKRYRILDRLISQVDMRVAGQAAVRPGKKKRNKK
ncbi:MAG: FtsQ-type POTRA domain-containing protein [Magnetococcales bacterium]|nr:FtsQ-type POTRA domain-containing protein [Magnetococcales bacterium]